MSRLLAKWRQDELEAEHTERLRRATPSYDVPDAEEARRRAHIPAGGDPWQLRGIPVVGSGVGGATPGSAPHQHRLVRQDS